MSATLVSAQEHTADPAGEAQKKVNTNKGFTSAIVCARTIAPEMSLLAESLARSPGVQHGYTVAEQGGQVLLSTTRKIGETLRLVDTLLCRFYAYRQLTAALTWLADDSGDPLRIVDTLSPFPLVAER